MIQVKLLSAVNRNYFKYKERMGRSKCYVADAEHGSSAIHCS